MPSTTLSVEQGLIDDLRPDPASPRRISDIPHPQRRSLIVTTHTDAIPFVPVTRADRYPHTVGPEAGGDAPIERLGVTRLLVDMDAVEAGRVTLAAIGDIDDAWGFEFDLSPADAVRLAGWLVEAAGRAGRPDGSAAIDGAGT